MNETFEFLKKDSTGKVNFLATINGDAPSCRPFGDPIWFDGKIYIMTNRQKSVAKQIAKNNNACIVAYDKKNWLRLNCKLIDDSDNADAKSAFLKEFDWCKSLGYSLDNPDFQIFYIANAHSAIYDEDGNIAAEYNF
jgi:uncharacterized pyridoxamine 5'-phosphate oxidase family protein